eukprot:jgi/Bigna1/145316/aug1.97_g20024
MALPLLLHAAARAATPRCASTTLTTVPSTLECEGGRECCSQKPSAFSPGGASRALFHLEEHPKPSLIAAKLEEKLKSLHAQCTTCNAKWKAERDFRIFCEEENINQEVQEELLWADLAENEVDKLTLLPRSTDNDETHNVTCEFRELEQIEPKTGWIPDPDPGSFFSRDVVKKQHREILENCRLSMKNDHAVFKKTFATQWIQIVGGKGSGKSVLAEVVARSMWHDNDGPDAIYWVLIMFSVHVCTRT